ncbi:MAG: YHS domain-containing protein [Candidatus Eremiobacteraeota bacterium]|nr:YHS domain-containing protein [Candidatus Eremiobacteraeota bacterium]
MLASSTRIFMIGLLVLILSVFLYFRLGLSDIKPEKVQPRVPSEPSFSQTPIDLPVDLNKITCPVCGKIVNPAKAARKERFYDRILYFDSEECYQKFLNDPIKYSKNLKVKINIDIEPAPAQFQPEQQQPQYYTPRSPVPAPVMTPKPTPATSPEDSELIPREEILEEIPLDGIGPEDQEIPMVEELPSM